MELKAAQEITLKLLADFVPLDAVDLHAAGVMCGQPSWKACRMLASRLRGLVERYSSRLPPSISSMKI